MERPDSLTGNPVTIPQQQISDNSPTELQEKLFARLSTLPGVSTSQSALSVRGARGFMLTEAHTTGPEEAFLVQQVREFAHLHPGHDGSLTLRSRSVWPQMRSSTAGPWPIPSPGSGSLRAWCWSTDPATSANSRSSPRS